MFCKNDLLITLIFNRLHSMPVVCCFRRIQWLGFRYSRNPLYFCNGIKRYWTSWIYSASRSNHTCSWRNLGFPCIECKTDYWRICCLNQFIRLLHIYLTQFNLIHIFSFRYCTVFRKASILSGSGFHKFLYSIIESVKKIVKLLSLFLISCVFTKFFS